MYPLHYVRFYFIGKQIVVHYNIIQLLCRM